MNRLGQFSLGWCVGIIILHGVVTLILALLIFMGGMASFTYGPGSSFCVAEVLMWIWSPFAFLLEKENYGFAIPTKVVALIWSFIVGLLAAFAVPMIRKPRIFIPISPGINPDLIGTPWEQKTRIKFPTLREMEHNKELEPGVDANRLSPSEHEIMSPIRRLRKI